jgi:PAS domain S-box-containing protein
VPDTRAHQGLTDVPFHLLVDSVQDYAIFMLDAGGHIISWNRGAERIKGYTEKEIVGQHFSTFYPPEDRERGIPERGLSAAKREGHFEGEGWRVRKDGSRFWANVVITAVYDDTGTLLGFGKVTRDLTEKKWQDERDRQLERERAGRAEAEAANRAKSQFLTTMSHELRTPLNAIIGHIDLLELGVQGPLSDPQRTSLERIRRSSKYLLSLINDILNVARVESGVVEYEIETVNANELLVGLEDLVTPQFAAHGVTFIRVVCDPAVRIRSDADKTRQILLNLLTNAYRFTDAGGSVELACASHDDHVAITVKDTGRGIAPERLASIFEPFVQIDRHLSAESQQGVGLGLSISRELARRMGGDLTVVSTLGSGSTFTLILPAAK